MANLSSKIQGVSQAAQVIVTPWVTYTPTFGLGFGTVTTSSIKWRRNGSNLELMGEFTAGTIAADLPTITLPTGLTIDTNVVTAAKTKLGEYHHLTASSMVTVSALTSVGQKQGVLFYSSFAGTGKVYFAAQTNGSGLFRDDNGTDIGATGEVFTIRASVPIAGWESGTLQTANTYQVEYAYNSSTTDAADSTSFAYGASGGQFGSFSTANRAKRVRFNSVQPTDRVELEIFDTTQWVPVAQSFAIPLSSTTGMSVRPVAGSSTDFDVYFGSAGYAATPQGTAGAWSTVASNSNYKWRLKKVSGGIQGFGNATTTTPGLVTLAQLNPKTDWASLTVSAGNGQTTGAIKIGGSTTAPAFGTVAWAEAWWCRDGADMLIRLGYAHTSAGTVGSGTYIFQLPAGNTIDSTRIGVSGNSARAVVGTAEVEDATKVYTGNVQVYSNTALMLFVGNELTTPNSFGSTAISWANTSLRVGFEARIPIAEWAGSLPGLVSDSQVEFAYNTSSSTSSDLTSFATGVTGVNFVNYAASGTTPVTRRVRFATALQSTDTVVLETDGGTAGARWFPLSERVGGYGMATNGSVGWGFRISAATALTDVDVDFYPTYDAYTVNNWGVLAGWKWRVKKVKSSISALVDNATATSYGLVKGGYVPGKTDGVAIVSGNVGEVVTQTRLRSAALGVTTATTANVTSVLTIGAGVWALYGNVGFNTTGTTNVTRWEAAISRTSATLPASSAIGVQNSSGEIWQISSSGSQTPANDLSNVLPVVIVNLTSSTSFYLVAQSTFTVSTIGVFGTLTAVRIA